NSTFCVHCCALGEVANFIEGRYCSEICRRTTKMLEAEDKLKAQKQGAVAQTTKDKVKKKVTKKKAPEPSTSATASADSKMRPPSAPVIYAKKTTISPIELSGAPTLVPQFLPPINLKEFAQTGPYYDYGRHKIEAMEQEEVVLRIEDRTP